MSSHNMRRALALGQLAQGLSSPNPAVGAVLVRDGRIVGEGYTQPPGGPHAEAVALTQAGEQARGAALYVTLEPCSTHGRTPPCTQAIIAAGVQEVHLAVLDANPAVTGRGQQALSEAGVRVVVGEEADAAQEANEAYFKHIRTGEPFIVVKYAMSLDGKIATRSGNARWVTGLESRSRVHELRATMDAVLTGLGTILKDDPQLTARDSVGVPHSRQPWRVVVDSRGRTPTASQIFEGPGHTLIATASREACEPFDHLGEAVTARAFPGSEGQVDLVALLKFLGNQNVVRVLVEAGGTLVGSLFDAGLVDRAVVFIALVMVGGSGAPGPVAGHGIERMVEALHLQNLQIERVGIDLLMSGVLRVWPAGS